MTRIAVYGGGAVGCLLAGHLTRSGSNVTLIDPWEEHIAAIRARGLAVIQDSGEFRVPISAVHSTQLVDVGLFDFIIIAVKSYDTVAAIMAIQPHLSRNGSVVSAQNGINEEQIIPLLGSGRTIGCVINFSAALSGPGQVTRTDATDSLAIMVGETDGTLSSRLETLKELLSSVGPTRMTRNLWGERWAKLTTNCMMNSLAGLTGYGSRQIRQDPRMRMVAIQIGAEVVTVAQALQIQLGMLLGGIDPQELLLASRGEPSLAIEKLVDEGGRRGSGVPSLLQDILKGRMTEIDYLNGLVVRKGMEMDILTPLNSSVVRLVKEVELGIMAPDPKNLDRLGSMPD